MYCYLFVLSSETQILTSSDTYIYNNFFSPGPGLAEGQRGHTLQVMRKGIFSFQKEGKTFTKSLPTCLHVL